MVAKKKTVSRKSPAAKPPAVKKASPNTASKPAPKKTVPVKSKSSGAVPVKKKAVKKSYVKTSTGLMNIRKAASTPKPKTKVSVTSITSASSVPRLGYSPKAASTPSVPRLGYTATKANPSSISAKDRVRRTRIKIKRTYIKGKVSRNLYSAKDNLKGGKLRKHFADLIKQKRNASAKSSTNVAQTAASKPVKASVAAKPKRSPFKVAKLLATVQARKSLGRRSSKMTGGEKRNDLARKIGKASPLYFNRSATPVPASKGGLSVGGKQYKAAGAAKARSNYTLYKLKKGQLTKLPNQ